MLCVLGYSYDVKFFRKPSRKELLSQGKVVGLTNGRGVDWPCKQNVLKTKSTMLHQAVTLHHIEYTMNMLIMIL